jgi:hypothetical protein
MGRVLVTRLVIRTLVEAKIACCGQFHPTLLLAGKAYRRRLMGSRDLG